MKIKETFDQETDFFSGKKIDEIAVLSFKEKLFLKLTEWEPKDNVLDYFDFVSRSDAIKVIVIECPYHSWHDDYFEFYSRSSGSGLDTTVFHRMVTIQQKSEKIIKKDLTRFFCKIAK